MGCLKERLCSLLNNRWFVFVAAMWIQSCAGVGYLFGSISPTIKSSLNYNQKQVASLGVAKDLGDCVGFLAGTLSEILPLWAALLVGAVQNLVGYGWVWLVVTGRTPVLPLWAMCVLIFIGTNGETYFNTASLVSCVQNFPKSRGQVVGILKGFAGLSGAILTQVYALTRSPDRASLILMVAVGPTAVVVALMFIVRPVGPHNKHVRPSDALSFSIIFSVCLVLASYLMAVMLLQDLLDLTQSIITIFTVVLIVILLTPILIPFALTFSGSNSTSPEEEELLTDEINVLIFSEKEDESFPALERQKRIVHLDTRLAQAAAEGAVALDKRRPRRGEDFDLTEALVKADFWLIFFSLLLGSGSGLTVIDNLGQMSQSLGYENTHVFVSMISIWNFLGRVGGGYISEKIVGDYAYPRPVALAAAQVIMAIGHFIFAMGWPGAMYLGTLLVGLGYGSHWAILPATASELFGLKKFGAIYNFLTLANPGGSLVFSGLIASSIYDNEAEKQAHHRSLLISSLSNFVSSDEEPLKCVGSICFFLTSLIMSGFCVVAAVLSMILVYRTKPVYANLYGKPRG